MTKRPLAVVARSIGARSAHEVGRCMLMCVGATVQQLLGRLYDETISPR
jgi:hypothetical protein